MIDKGTIPRHWEIKQLSDVGEIVSGGTPSTKNPEYWNGNIAWVTPADLSEFNGSKIGIGKKSISKIGLSHSSARLIPKGSVLFSSRAPIGYVAIAVNELCTNQGFKSVIPNESIISEFLYYFLKASKNTAENVASGTTFKEISSKIFSRLEIPLPPKNEQYQIVSKIEELFSELEKGKQQLETVKLQLKTYRQAVLKWAFEGKFTSGTGRDLSIQDHKQSTLPEGWKWLKLSEIGEIISGGTPSTKEPTYWNGNISWITPADLSGYKQKHIQKGNKSITELGLKNSSARLMPKGSVLFSSRAPIGYVVIAAKELSTNQGFKSIVPNKLITSDFLFHYLKASKDRAEKKASGTTFKEISAKIFSALEIPLPSTHEQNQIVQEIETRLSVCDKIEETITECVDQSESLRQSILKQAFEGKLVKII